MLATVFLQQRGKYIHADGHASSETQRAAQRLLALTDHRDRFLDVAEHAVAQLHERIAGRRNPNPAPYSQEDALIQLVFEQQHLAADSRLRYTEFPARAGKRAGLGYGLHDFKLAQ